MNRGSRFDEQHSAATCQPEDVIPWASSDQLSDDVSIEDK